MTFTDDLAEGEITLDKVHDGLRGLKICADTEKMEVAHREGRTGSDPLDRPV